MLCTSGFVDDVMFYTMGPVVKIRHDVMFGRSSPGGNTSWTSYNDSVWQVNQNAAVAAKSAIYD